MSLSGWFAFCSLFDRSIFLFANILASRILFFLKLLTGCNTWTLIWPIFEGICYGVVLLVTIFSGGLGVDFFSDFCRSHLWMTYIFYFGTWLSSAFDGYSHFFVFMVVLIKFKMKGSCCRHWWLGYFIFSQFIYLSVFTCMISFCWLFLLFFQ